MKNKDIHTLRKINLRDLSSYFNDGDWIEKRHQDKSGIWLIQTGNVGVINFRDKEEKKYVNEEIFKKLNCKEVLAGDILISRLPDPVGRSCVVPDLKGKAITAVDCTIVRLKEDYVKDYVNFLINSKSTQDQIKTYLSGSSRKRISRTNLEKITIPVPFINGQPDVNEQKRIVKKIQDVLILGELSNKEIEQANRLIDSLCVSYFELAKDSQSIQLGDVCDVIKGRSPTLKTPAGKFPLVVTAEERKTANDYQIDDEAVCIPLVSSTGHGHASLKRIHYQTGKFALANIMVALLSKNKKEMLPKFLFYYLSYFKDSLLVSLMRGGANVTIPINEIYKVKVNLPDVERQKKFVMVINQIEQLKDRLLKREILNNQLLNSTLNYAFEGEL